MKYRALPFIVDAQQWWPPGDPAHDPTMLSHRKGNSVTPGDYRQMGDIYCFAEGMGRAFGGDIYFIRTGGPNDNIQLKPGDWVVTLETGQKMVFPMNVFLLCYEPAKEA